MIYRSKEELDLSGLPAKSQENIRIALEKEALVISLGAKLKIAKLKAIRDWFSTVSFADFGNPVENYFLSSRIPEGFAEDRAVQKKVADYRELLKLIVIITLNIHLEFSILPVGVMKVQILY